MASALRVLLLLVVSSLLPLTASAQTKPFVNDEVAGDAARYEDVPEAGLQAGRQTAGDASEARRQAARRQ